LSALALPDEEPVPFNDYGPQFQVEAQATTRVVFDLRRLTPGQRLPAILRVSPDKTVRADAGDWRLLIGGSGAGGSPFAGPLKRN
jgi:hypothetical protein